MAIGEVCNVVLIAQDTAHTTLSTSDSPLVLESPDRAGGWGGLKEDSEGGTLVDWKTGEKCGTLHRVVVSEVAVVAVEWKGGVASLQNPMAFA